MPQTVASKSQMCFFFLKKLNLYYATCFCATSRRTINQTHIFVRQVEHNEPLLAVTLLIICSLISLWIITAWGLRTGLSASFWVFLSAHSCRQLSQHCPNTPQKTTSPRDTAHHTLTPRQKDRARVCCVIAQAARCVPVKAPGQRGWEDGWRSGHSDVISSPLGGIQVFAGLKRTGGN